MRSAAWRIWVDTGGTFTDGIAVAPDGNQRRVKILSNSALRGVIVRAAGDRRLQVEENWNAPDGLVPGFEFRLLDGSEPVSRIVDYDAREGVVELDRPLGHPAPSGLPFEARSPEEAPILAARLLTSTPADSPLPDCRMRLATTLGTNALLERAGAPTVLFISKGFGDLLAIGTQQRPDLFDLRARRPRPLYEEVIEVEGRLDAAGDELQPLDLETIRPAIAELLQRGIRVAAVALLHAFRDPAHEQALRDLLLREGFEHVSCSAELAPRIKLLQRAETAVVDAYLSPKIRSYLDRVHAALGSGELLVMTSAGGLLDPTGFRPKDSLLSGPAGGVVGAARGGLDSGQKRLITFDMGGTSTDVARFDGDYEYCYEQRVGDALLAAPALALQTVAAGGGSICWLDGERLRVGPQSAGAHPGPACYRAGGPLTLTDVNLLLGRLAPDGFSIPVDPGPSRVRLDELCEELSRRTGASHSPEELLEGLVAIADETMADAIRRVSLRQGYDPADHALVSFGGAGGQHACGIAERLGIDTIVVPPDAALLSARGLGAARLERFMERQVLRPLDAVDERIPDLFRELEDQAVSAVADAGAEQHEIEVRRRLLHLRFAGQDASLEIDWPTSGPVSVAFEERYQTLFGHRPERRAVELESMRVVASTRSAGGLPPEDAADAGRSPITGPALIHQPNSTTVVARGWNATHDQQGAVILERTGAASSGGESRPTAIELELFTQRFYTLVREMGERLERTAVSTNVKERLDFSCALLDPEGELVVNAPHIPVHLGALGLCVRMLAARTKMRPGDVVLTNHPAYGGSHLPDVTVVTPVFSKQEPRQLLGYVASRAHHSEIGGIRPGSMPPDATCLAEEGVVLDPIHVIAGGKPRWSEVRERLLAGPHPTRSVEDNLADMRAAVAANHSGAQALAGLAEEHGDERILHFMSELQQLAERRIREALTEISDGSYSAIERLDDGSPLSVRIDLRGDRARIDFSGSADVHPGNLNATPAIVQSAVLYVMRLLLREPLPLNEGLLRAVEIELPGGILNPEFGDDPALAPAVVGGNVETSQRLVDTLLKALGIVACSQGTMNNLIFGNQSYGYYETLGGGCGAGPDFDGASAVHSHMTNTRITDPEVLEHRYPVRVHRFALRRGSGGAGRRRGGDGLVREIEFLEPASLSMLTQHRTVPPYGVAGGEPGRPGTQRVVRRDGTVESLGSVDGREVAAGDRVIVETPGGGGFGEKD